MQKSERTFVCHEYADNPGNVRFIYDKEGVDDRHLHFDMSRVSFLEILEEIGVIEHDTQSVYTPDYPDGMDWDHFFTYECDEIYYKSVFEAITNRVAMREMIQIGNDGFVTINGVRVDGYYLAEIAMEATSARTSAICAELRQHAFDAIDAIEETANHIHDAQKLVS